MLTFTAKYFRVGVEISLYLNLITSIILGYWIGGKIGQFFIINSSILGAIIGLAVGILENILIGGFIAVILKIDENLEIIKDNSFRN